MFDEQSRFVFGNPATCGACCCLQAGCVNFNLVQVTPEKIGVRSRKKTKKKKKTRKGGSAVIRPDCRPMNVSSVDETSRAAPRRPPAPWQSYLQHNTGVLLIRHREADVSSAACRWGFFSPPQEMSGICSPSSYLGRYQRTAGAVCLKEQRPLNLSFISRPSESPIRRYDAHRVRFRHHPWKLPPERNAVFALSVFQTFLCETLRQA